MEINFVKLEELIRTILVLDSDSRNIFSWIF